jgi:hypothetical protein
MGVGGLLILLALLFVADVFRELMGSAVLQSGLILIAFLFFILAWIWGKLPEWFRKFIRNQLRKRRDRHAEE